MHLHNHSKSWLRAFLCHSVLWTADMMPIIADKMILEVGLDLFTLKELMIPYA